MSILLSIGDVLALVALCLFLLLAIVVILAALVGIGKAIYDGWKDGADNE